MVEVRDLTKTYGPYQAVQNISFTVKKGEVVGFLGPNGAGKTTTMKMITGYMAPTSGSISVAGFDVFDSPIDAKRRIGYLPETPPLYGDMTVRAYLDFVARLKGVEKTRVKQMVDLSIEKTNLGSVSHRLIQNLSKGYRQRVGISQALVSDPEVLILDEPTVGLDPRQVAEVRDLIRELRGQHTVILSTHILPEVQAACERIIIINNGVIVAQDSLASLTDRASGSGRVYLRVSQPSEKFSIELRAVPGVKGLSLTEQGLYKIDTTGTKDIAQQLAAKAVTSGAGLMELREESLNLEDIFLKLTTKEESQGVHS